MEELEFRELERAFERHDWRLDALDEWRREVDKRVSVVESKVHDLEFTNSVADALAKRLADQHRFELTLFQKVGAGVFALVLVLVPIVVGKVWS